MSFVRVVDESGALLAGAKRLAFALIERLAVPAFVLDEHCKVLVWNSACEQLTGVAASEVLGTDGHWRAFYNERRPCLADLIVQDKADHSDILYAVRHRTGEGRGLFAENWCMMPKRGRERYLAIDASPVFDEQGKLIGAIETLRDITEHKRTEAAIEFLATHDALTGLANRASFKTRLADLEKRDAPYALLLIDVDRFKEVNDTLGHAAGDAILTNCANLFARVCPWAHAARIGGDEFALVLNEEPEQASTVAETLIALASEGVEFEGTNIAISFSIGISKVPEDARDAARASRCADQALYLAKSAGGGAYREFEPAMEDQSSSRRAAIVDLRKALERNEFVLHYQPICKLDGDVVGFEALLRWQHPKRGMVTPAEFIPVAEQSGLIGPLGEWALRQACAEAARWAKPLQIAVNLSPVQFRLGDIAQTVHQVLLDTGLAASRLELEITESAMIENPSRTLATLRRLRGLGVRIAMDDFGTGYSSLGYLQSFPFDKIKLDRSFIARLGQNEQSDAITRAVIALGQTLSLLILAEGVETATQRDFLAREKCDLVQGYLFGRPAPLATYNRELGLSDDACFEAVGERAG